MSIAKELAALFRRDLSRLIQQIEAYPNDEIVWHTHPAITNSAGNLVLHLEGNLLVAPDMFDHIRQDRRRHDRRRSDAKSAVVVYEQYTVERDRLSRLDRQTLNLQGIPRFDAVLLTASF